MYLGSQLPPVKRLCHNDKIYNQKTKDILYSTWLEIQLTRSLRVIKKPWLLNHYDKMVKTLNISKE
jgi:hypothetical protein